MWLNHTLVMDLLANLRTCLLQHVLWSNSMFLFVQRIAQACFSTNLNQEHNWFLASVFIHKIQNKAVEAVCLVRDGHVCSYGKVDSSGWSFVEECCWGINSLFPFSLGYMVAWLMLFLWIFFICLCCSLISFVYFFTWLTSFNSIVRNGPMLISS